MADASTVVLVGFMGTGKSVVGKRLAQHLGSRYLDTDELIVRAAGRSIPQIFAAESESGFRDRETEVLRSLLGSQEQVIATGGGVMGRDENVALLKAIGKLVCLTARPEVILERTRPWQDRPMLAGVTDPLQTIERLLAERAPRYALADVVIDTSDLPIEGVVDAICRALK